MLKAMVVVVGVAALVACGKGDSKDGVGPGKGGVAKKDVKKDPPSDKDRAEAAKHQTSEAKFFLKKMYDGARAYYMESSMGGGLTPIPSQFPAPSQGPTPALGACCEQKGRCAPQATSWTSETWTALMFSVDDPHSYSYSYETNDEFTSFTVRANGDLDCDGTYSTFEMYGLIDENNPDGPAGDAKLNVVNELE
jgi:hypothetical protein